MPAGVTTAFVPVAARDRLGSSVSQPTDKTNTAANFHEVPAQARTLPSSRSRSTSGVGIGSFGEASVRAAVRKCARERVGRSGAADPASAMRLDAIELARGVDAGALAGNTCEERPAIGLAIAGHRVCEIVRARAEAAWRPDLVRHRGIDAGQDRNVRTRARIARAACIGGCVTVFARSCARRRRSSFRMVAARRRLRATRADKKRAAEPDQPATQKFR
jgi:hypothetical protein